MASSPDLLKKVDSKRVRSGETTPYHTGFFVPVNSEQAQQPEMLQVVKFTQRILDPALQLQIEGIDTHAPHSNGRQIFDLSIHGLSLPTYITSWKFWDNRAVELDRLFDREQVETESDWEKRINAPLKRRTSLYIKDLTPYLSEEQVLTKEIPDEAIPVILREVQATPFRFKKGSRLTSEDPTRAIITLTTQDAISFLQTEQHNIRSSWETRFEELKDRKASIDDEIRQGLITQGNQLQDLKNAKTAIQQKFSL